MPLLSSSRSRTKKPSFLTSSSLGATFATWLFIVKLDLAKRERERPVEKGKNRFWRMPNLSNARVGNFIFEIRRDQTQYKIYTSSTLSQILKKEQTRNVPLSAFFRGLNGLRRETNFGGDAA